MVGARLEGPQEPSAQRVVLCPIYGLIKKRASRLRFERGVGALLPYRVGQSGQGGPLRIRRPHQLRFRVPSLPSSRSRGPLIGRICALDAEDSGCILACSFAKSYFAKAATLGGGLASAVVIFIDWPSAPAAKASPKVMRREDSSNLITLFPTVITGSDPSTPSLASPATAGTGHGSLLQQTALASYGQALDSDTRKKVL